MMNFGDTNRRRGNSGSARNYKPNRYAARENYEKRRMEKEIHQWSHDESKNSHGSRYQDRSRRHTNYEGGNEFDHNDTTRKPYKSRTRYDGYESRDAYDENEYNFNNKNRSDWNAHRCYDVEHRDKYRASERNHNTNRSVYAGDQRQSGTDTRGSYRTPEKKDAGENRGAYGYKRQFQDKQRNEKYYRKEAHERIENYSSEINTKSANHGQYDTNARRSTYDEYGDTDDRNLFCRGYSSNKHNCRDFQSMDNPERFETFGGEKQDNRSNSLHSGYHTSKSHHGVSKETKHTESRNLTFCDTERVVSRNGSWNESKHVHYGDTTFNQSKSDRNNWTRKGDYGKYNQIIDNNSQERTESFNWKRKERENACENRYEGVSPPSFNFECDRQHDMSYGFPTSRSSAESVKSFGSDDSVVILEESYMTYDEYLEKETNEQRRSDLPIYENLSPTSSTNFLCK